MMAAFVSLRIRVMSEFSITEISPRSSLCFWFDYKFSTFLNGKITWSSWVRTSAILGRVLIWESRHKLGISLIAWEFHCLYYLNVGEIIREGWHGRIQHCTCILIMVLTSSQRSSIASILCWHRSGKWGKNLQDQFYISIKKSLSPSDELWAEPFTLVVAFHSKQNLLIFSSVSLKNTRISNMNHDDTALAIIKWMYETGPQQSML